MVSTEIKAIVKQYLSVLNDSGLKIDHAYLFGSCARGENGENSDIDLMLVSDIFDTDDDRILSRPWIYTANVDHRLEPVSVGTIRFSTDTLSPLIDMVKRDGIEIV